MESSQMQSFDTLTIMQDQAIVCLHSTTRIAAPASLVFRTLRNTDTWKDWNKFVPKVNITYEPPDEDVATSAEIEQLVKNTSIAGSYDSDLTDGSIGGSNKNQNAERPVTPELKLRRSSVASGTSARTSMDSRKGSLIPTNGGRLSISSGNGEPRLSAAQKYAAATAERKASIAAGMTPPPIDNSVPASSASPYMLVTPGSPRNFGPPEIDPSGRRKSKTPSLQKAMAARVKSLNLLYGEPSVRLQLHTRMTFFMRFNPHNQHEYKQVHLVVTEVSRPDDPMTEGSNLTQLTRSQTHTLNRVGVYRIVWQMDSTLANLSNMKNGSAYPKSLLATERVHEIRPITLGDGSEECELRTWELQKGTLAKMVKKKYETYLQTQFENWGKGLGDFCEGMGGKVDRRDFSVIVDEDETPVGIITF